MLPLLVKIDCVIFEAKDITKTQFQQQFMVPTHKQMLLRNADIEK